jgi:cytochrome c oxidase subunit II
MDKYEKYALIIATALCMTFFGAVVYASTGLGVQLPTCITDIPPFKVGEIVENGKNIKVNVVAKMWLFDMGDENANILRVPQGSTVNFYLTSADVVHGFHIDGRNVNLMAVPGAITNSVIRFDKVGEYNIVCHEYCGIMHQQMAGKIIVMSDADYQQMLNNIQG